MYYIFYHINTLFIFVHLRSTKFNSPKYLCKAKLTELRQSNVCAIWAMSLWQVKVYGSGQLSSNIFQFVWSWMYSILRFCCTKFDKEQIAHLGSHIMDYIKVAKWNVMWRADVIGYKCSLLIALRFLDRQIWPRNICILQEKYLVNKNYNQNLDPLRSYAGLTHTYTHGKDICFYASGQKVA